MNTTCTVRLHFVERGRGDTSPIPSVYGRLDIPLSNAIHPYSSPYRGPLDFVRVPSLINAASLVFNELRHLSKCLSRKTSHSKLTKGVRVGKSQRTRSSPAPYSIRRPRAPRETSSSAPSRAAEEFTLRDFLSTRRTSKMRLIRVFFFFTWKKKIVSCLLLYNLCLIPAGTNYTIGSPIWIAHFLTRQIFSSCAQTVHYNHYNMK